MLQNVLPSSLDKDFNELAHDVVVQKAFLGVFQADAELDRTEYGDRVRKLPGWETISGQKLGKICMVMCQLGVLAREDRGSNTRIYSPGSMASQLTEVASVTVNYDPTFTALWVAYPKGELVPAQAKHHELGFVGLDDLNEFVELMLKRGHVIRASIKNPSHVRITYTGIRLTSEGKQHLAELQGYNQSPTVPATELEKPPRSEVAPAPLASEHLALIAALEHKVMQLTQSVIAAQTARITDVLRGQPTSIAQTCLIEAGRQLGLDLVPRLSV